MVDTVYSSARHRYSDEEIVDEDGWLSTEKDRFPDTPDLSAYLEDSILTWAETSAGKKISF